MAVKIRERPEGSGVWWVFIDHHDKRKAKKIGRNKKLAQEVAKKIEARLVLNDFNLDNEKATDHPVPLFRDYAKLWLEGYIKELRRDSTYERYWAILRLHLNPVFGKKSIDQIKRSEIRDLFLKKYRAGLSRNTVRLIRDVLSGIVGYAVDEELIQVNPVTGVIKKLGLDRKRNAPVESMTQEEVSLTLKVCARDYPELYPFFLTAFRTGMRLGELLGLQWGDIDWNGKFIHVQRSYKNQKINPTKTGETRRVDMSDQLIESLRELYTERKREALKSGRGEIEEFVFHRRNKPLAQNSIRNVWRQILRRAGLRYRKFHVTRHTFASLLLSNGESLVYVKEQLGHSSIKITVDIYGHLIPSSNRNAVNQLDDSPESATFRNLSATSGKVKSAIR